MVVNRDRQIFFRIFLAYDIFVEKFFDFFRLRKLFRLLRLTLFSGLAHSRHLLELFDMRVKHIQAVVAYIHVLIHTRGQQYSGFLLGASAERAYILILFLRHFLFVFNAD